MSENKTEMLTGLYITPNSKLPVVGSTGPIVMMTAKMSTLDDYMTIEQELERAIRGCYQSEGKMSREKANDKFIEARAREGHFKPFEMISFMFEVRGINRTCSHQIVRHALPVLQASTRFCRPSQYTLVVSEKKAKFLGGTYIKQIRDFFEALKITMEQDQDNR